MYKAQVVVVGVGISVCRAYHTISYHTPLCIFLGGGCCLITFNRTVQSVQSVRSDNQTINQTNQFKPYPAPAIHPIERTKSFLLLPIHLHPNHTSALTPVPTTSIAPLPSPSAQQPKARPVPVKSSQIRFLVRPSVKGGWGNSYILSVCWPTSIKSIDWPLIFPFIKEGHPGGLFFFNIRSLSAFLPSSCF